MPARRSTLKSKSGIVVLNAAGKLLFANHRAETLLTFHFPACAGNGPWPDRLGRWITQSTLGSHPTRGSVSAPQRSERAGRRLTVRLVETRLERILLLDEERLFDHAPNRGFTDLRILGVTRRESEVLRWIVEGKSNPEIGIILHIAVRTVKKHLEHIFEKLGVENRTCAAARASEVLSRRPSSELRRVRR